MSGDGVGAADPGPPLALWPFQTAAQAQAWELNQQAAGGDPSHRLDPAATALEFTRGALGFTGIDRVTASTGTADGWLVGVGLLTESGVALTVATLRLVRLGTGAGAPWVVVGTADVVAGATVLTPFDRPTPGASVRSPLEVGGRVTGSDEALRVVVLAPDGRVLGRAGPIGVGGRDQPWSATVELAAASAGAVLTVAVSTGGHVADVEWFAVVGVRLV